jgi:hypothetical protein
MFCVLKPNLMNIPYKRKQLLNGKQWKNLSPEVSVIRDLLEEKFVM